jgi:hypothetical protein
VVDKREGEAENGEWVSESENGVFHCEDERISFLLVLFLFISQNESQYRQKCFHVTSEQQLFVFSFHQRKRHVKHQKEETQDRKCQS